MSKKVIVKVQLPVDMDKAEALGEMWPDRKLKPGVLIHDEKKEFVFCGPNEQVWQLMDMLECMKMFFEAKIDDGALEIIGPAEWQDW